MWLPLLFLVVIFFVALIVLRKLPSRKPDRRRVHEELPDPILGLSEVKPKPLEEVSSDMDESFEMITFYIMAPAEYPYNGYELLQSLLSNGLRYGKQNIFHRYETKTGCGRILFSLASVNKPGTFELSKMGGFSCPGLVLFMLLKRIPDAMGAFEVMLETARQLSEDLGGEIWGEDRRVLTMDTISKLRTRVVLFEESQPVFVVSAK